MNKSIVAFTESVHNGKTDASHVAHRPQKVQRHRHERRKMRESLRLGDWLQDA
jgi:hypothetical protein